MDRKRSVFIPMPKKGNAKECSNYHTISLISHTSRVMVKILQARLQQYANCELPDVQGEFRKSRNQRSNCQHPLDHRKSKSFRKTSTFPLLTMPKPLTVDHNRLWKILKEMGIPGHLTCLLRNLYAGQEAAIRTGHGTTDWFKMGEGIHHGCILSPCLFNFYAEYIMRNAMLDEVQAGIKTVGEISITSDMQMTPPLWQKGKRN